MVYCCLTIYTPNKYVLPYYRSQFFEGGIGLPAELLGG